MRSKITKIMIVCLLFCLGITVPVARGHGPCTLETMTGTYAFYKRGSRSIVDLSATTPYPLHWSAAIAPFANVGEITFGPDGVGTGYFWLWAGLAKPGLDPMPLQATITEMNPDCTGKFTYALPSSAIEERLIVIDNGRELRSVPIAGGVLTLAWIGVGQRIRKSSDPVSTCGPQIANGSDVISVENLVTHNQTTAYADSLLLRVDVSLSGDYTGSLYEKLGSLSIDGRPASGAFTFNPDCSFMTTLNVQGVPGRIAFEGVFFAEGKELYGLGIRNFDSAEDQQGLRYSFVQAKRIDQ